LHLRPGDARRQCAGRAAGAGDFAPGRGRRRVAGEPLFNRPDAGVDGDLIADLKPDSLAVLSDARVEPALADTASDETVQFERQGYFCLDPDSRPGRLVFNRTIALRTGRGGCNQIAQSIKSSPPRKRGPRASD
jgi:hypothetical protein